MIMNEQEKLCHLRQRMMLRSFPTRTNRQERNGNNKNGNYFLAREFTSNAFLTLHEVLILTLERGDFTIELHVNPEMELLLNE